MLIFNNLVVQILYNLCCWDYLKHHCSTSKYYYLDGKILSCGTLVPIRDSIPYVIFSLSSDAESNISHRISPGSDRHPSTVVCSLCGFPCNLHCQCGWECSHPDGCHLWSKTLFSYIFFPGKPVMSRYLLLHGDSAKDAGELPLYTQNNFFLGMHKSASFLPLSG